MSLRHLLVAPLPLLLAGCVLAPEPESEGGPGSEVEGRALERPEREGPPEAQPHRNASMDEQVGVQHPPIPADDPVWDTLQEGFQGAPHFYGERSWDDVEMRIIGHISNATRDLAASAWQRGETDEARQLMRDLAIRLKRVPINPGTGASEIRQLYVDAAERDALLFAAMGGARLEAPPESGPISTLRRELLTAPPPGGNDEIARRVDELLASPPWEGVAIDEFEDFDDRHRLRLKLVELALDAVDPLEVGGVWGYWRPQESRRQAEAIAAAARAGDPTSATERAQRLRREEERATFTPDDLGWLPTGDSYIDTAGNPGPIAIGRLERLDRDDPEHRQWLEEWSGRLNEAMAESPEDLVEEVGAAHSELSEETHGSIFYNIKQAINSATRQAARAGHLGAAREIFAMHRPLHAQDWACPNREGIQLGIEGRLAILAGARAEGEETLRRAVAEGERWLERVGRAPEPRRNHHGRGNGPGGPPQEGQRR